MQNSLNQLATILNNRAALAKERKQKRTHSFQVGKEKLTLYVGMTVDETFASKETPCTPSMFQIVKGSSPSFGKYAPVYCVPGKPKMSLNKTIKSAIDGDYFNVQQILVDGDPIELNYRSFDLPFYSDYVQRFISSEEDLVDFLQLFDASFGANDWYKNADGGWLNRLISDSKWGSVNLKAVFGCLQYEDACFLPVRFPGNYTTLPLVTF